MDLRAPLPDDLRRSLAAAAQRPFARDSPGSAGPLWLLPRHRLTQPAGRHAAPAAVRGRRDACMAATSARCARSSRSVTPPGCPGAPPYVRGLINLRGAIVTVIDLAARLAGCRGRAGGLGRARGIRATSRSVWPSTRSMTSRCSPPTGSKLATGDVARDGIVRGLGHLDDGVVLVLDVPCSRPAGNGLTGRSRHASLVACAPARAIGRKDFDFGAGP